ncbi:MAG: hypothetical protein OWU84_06265 [Firmicutes bacterium]|nr:hypothetical protein [Bacillota bacterium]
MAKKGTHRERSPFWEELQVSPNQLGAMIREVSALPGALEQLAEYTAMAAEGHLLEQFVDELMQVPEAMPFLGRLAFALEMLGPESPRVIRRIRREAERRGISRQLYPDAWYPWLAGPFRVYATPSRLRAHFMVMRFCFLESGVEVLWDINFAGGGLMSAAVLEAPPDDLEEEPWHEVPPDTALRLIQSARWLRDWYGADELREGWLFTEVLWQIVAGGVAPEPAERVCYLMEPAPVEPKQVALSFVNACCHDDGLLAYDLLAPTVRESLPLDAFLLELGAGSASEGRLWRSWVVRETARKHERAYLLKTWHSTGWGIVERPWQLRLQRDREGFWYVSQFLRGRRTLWPPTAVQPYLEGTQRYYGIFPMAEGDAVPIDMVPETAVRDRSHGLAEVYRWGPPYDFCDPYDVARHLSMEWIFVEDRGLILYAAGEIAYRRERERLRSQGWIDEPVIEGVADRFQQEFWENAAAFGWDDLVGEPLGGEDNGEPDDRF